MAGPFYFAWVEEYQTSFDPSFEREDEDVFSFVVEHNENDIPQLTIEIKNPRIGLLAPGRKQWAWLSWDSASAGGSGVIPLFFGRLVAIPNGVNKEIITIVFAARPIGYLLAKAALAETLKVFPYWDPVFIAEQQRLDPDAVLEARTQLWHVDRVTLELTISDILVGEDGLVDFPATDVFYDSVEIDLNQAPLQQITIDATVSWTQAGTGGISLNTGTIITATGAALVSGWPKVGANLQGGWSVANGSAADTAGIAAYPNDNWTGKGFNTPAKPDGWLFVESSFTSIGVGGATPSSSLQEGVLVPKWQVSTSLSLTYNAERARTEQVQVTLATSLQPIVTLADEAELLTVNGADVGLLIDGVAPIGDIGRRSYFPTDRGLHSIEYLIALGRAHLLSRARAVQVKWECPFELAVGLSCRMNAMIHDHRLPGGQAAGKIISYGFAANVSDGQLVGTVTIGSAIGYAEAVVPTTGTPDYVATGYVEDYQHYTGQSILLGSGDIAYTVPIDAPDDDGLDLVGGLTRSDVLLAFSITNDWEVQTEILRQGLRGVTKVADALAAATALLDANPTTVSFTLRPVDGGPFAFLYPISTSLLTVPKMIDLEAAT